MLLAHSRRPPAPSQDYDVHVAGVRHDAVKYATTAVGYYTGDGEAVVGWVDAAAIYHDLGKADEANQEVLRRSSRDPLPVNHDDAGVAELRRLRRLEAMVLAYGHHGGLFSQDGERDKREGAFRNVTVAGHVDARLDGYVAAHGAEGLPVLAASTAPALLQRCGFTRRIALSCLVDADHGNTAVHYQNEVPARWPKPKWGERLAALDSYVSELAREHAAKSKDERQWQRQELRGRLYDACRAAETAPAIRSCDAPVGSGKTTAVMAHLLRVAEERKLRHIFVVLPYTNIIKQSVEVYRKALVLPGEDPTEIVAEHHHLADFAALELRQLATLWRAPVTVTTAVQFFETLAASNPARLRKLHELPGSAVLVDETHAAIPSHLWPQAWKWLEAWTGDWGGHLVLGSGSLPRFWELGDFVQPPKAPEEVPDLVPGDLRHDLLAAEVKRVTPQRKDRALESCSNLIEFVTSKPGPRILILNTVQSAAVLADGMRRCGHHVLHLSTALAPAHRAHIVDRVKERLLYGMKDWTLVATSCVEAGMDFSFRSGFRESASASSLIQVGGRVGREGEYSDAEVWDFRVEGDLLTRNPGLKVPAEVLKHLFASGQVEGLAPAELATVAMRCELTEGHRQDAEGLCGSEAAMEYPTVGELFRVIQSDTRLVVVSPGLIETLGQCGKDRRAARRSIGYRELLRNSVQIWASKFDKLPVVPLLGDADDPNALYAWAADYDPDFLGYMAGVLPILAGLQDGIFLA